jgi:Ca-activated chloride channel homolog
MRAWKEAGVVLGICVMGVTLFGCGGSEEDIDLNSESGGAVVGSNGDEVSPMIAPAGASIGYYEEDGDLESGPVYSAPEPQESWDDEGGSEGGESSEEGGEGYGGNEEGGESVEAEPELEEEVVTGEEAAADFITTNPYVLVEAQPTSTFASDSDTASYDMFRQFLSWNDIITPQNVRLEEFVNAFEYDYPLPEEGAEDPFKLNLDLAESPFTEGASILRIGIQGERVDREDFEGVNLVFLVDVSGSMGGSGKMPLVKVMLSEAVQQLGANDRVSIVTYSGMEKVHLASTFVDDKEAILASIESLNTGGSTAGAAGLQMAYEQAEAGWIEGGVNHVVLCTDGDFNVGISSTQALIEFIEEKRKTNVTLTAVGFGSYHNDEMMELVSNAGNGIYKLVTDMDDAIDYASDALISSLFFIAKDVKIQVEFNLDDVYAYRKLGYENRELEDWMFFEKTIDGGEIPQSHAVTALYELIPVGQSLPEVEGAPTLMTDIVEPLGMEITEGEMVLVKVRYKKPGASAEDLSKQVTASLGFGQAPLAFDDADSDLRFASTLAAFAEILKTSPYARPDMADDLLEILDETSGDHMDRLQLREQMVQAFELLEL